MLAPPRLARRRRRGLTLAEAAIVTSVFTTLVLGMFDLGLAAFRQQLVSRAARQGARLAIVHGQSAPSGFNGGTWGTATISTYANASGIPIVTGLASSGALNGLNASQTQVLVEWIDGNNDPEAERNRVRVTVTTPYQPMYSFILGGTAYTLSAASVMTVAH
jgi:Flp pilus assembly protein TadG